jgi:crotonobetainyl-CoA:carnitine CoA-transferase CaiB-like acyl-CoA transferase
MTAKMALDGVRVLDFTQMMAGPWGTQFLGDMGAEIIKIERRIKGDWERGLPAIGRLLGGDSPFFLTMNRNKKSLTLNLKDPRAVEILYKLAETADLVTQNFRPGVLESLGLGYDDFRKINPSIVYVSNSGYGPSGPYVDRPGQDLLAQSLSGLVSLGGRADDPPTPIPISYVDASTAMLLAFGAMVGLFHKQRTGEGQRIDVSLFNTAIAVQCEQLTAFMNFGELPPRSASGIANPWIAAPYGIYQTSDGYIAIAMNPIRVLAELLDLPELVEYDDPQRSFQERDTIKPLIEAKTRANTTAHWLSLFEPRDIWCAKVQNYHEVVNDPQVLHNGMIQTIQHPVAGEVKVIGNPIQYSETPATIRLNPPRVGEHNHELLTELGYSSEQIQVFEEEGVI